MTKQENIGLWIGAISTVIPALVMANFFPEFNVLPSWGWLMISGVGAMAAGVVASSARIAGAISGGLAGLGAIGGILAYTEVRSFIFQVENMLRLEIAIGAVLGALPGLAAYFKFARQNR